MKFSRRWLWLLIPAIALAAVAANPRWRDSLAHLLYKENLMTGYHRFSAETFFTGPQLELAQAIAGANLNKVEKLATQTDLNVHGQRNLSLLTFAINQIDPADEREYNDRFRIITALVKAGADVNDSNPPKEDATPLSIALQAISPNYLQALLDGGLSPNYVDEYEPILFEVAHDPLLASVKLLVERGANINERDSLGGVAIASAIETCQLDVVDYLLGHDPDLTAADHMGFNFAYNLFTEIRDQPADSPCKPQRLLAIRDRIIKQGAKWPPDPPEVERDRMRTREETPVVPEGQTR